MEKVFVFEIFVSEERILAQHFSHQIYLHLIRVQIVFHI